MNPQFLLNVLHQSSLNNKIGLNSDRCDGYYRGRVIAQHVSRNEIVPNLKSTSEIFGFLEYTLEHMVNDDNNQQVS